jgi:hypothetical protein
MGNEILVFRMPNKNPCCYLCVSGSVTGRTISRGFLTHHKEKWNLIFFMHSNYLHRPIIKITHVIYGRCKVLTATKERVLSCVDVHVDVNDVVNVHVDVHVDVALMAMFMWICWCPCRYPMSMSMLRFMSMSMFMSMSRCPCSCWRRVNDHVNDDA